MTVLPNIRLKLEYKESVMRRLLLMGTLVAVLALAAGRGVSATAQEVGGGASAATRPPEVVAGERRAGVLTDFKTYRIRVGDVLEIKVYQEEELNSVIRVNQEGVIALPLIGSVAVEGLTPDAAQLLVIQRYHAEFVVNPQVILTVKEFAPRRFSVMGEVARPGVFEIPAREKVNLLKAIALAGGYTRLADPTKIRIRRITDKGEEILKFNAKVLANEAVEMVPPILDDDNIIVGQSIF